MIGIRRLCVGIIIAAAAIWPASHRACAQTVQDRLVSSTFKTLAKTYITTADFKVLRDNTVKRLQQLDTNSFHQLYPRVLRIVDDAPVLKKELGLRSDMTVSQAIAFVKSLDKKKSCAVVDMIPDRVVAYHVGQFMAEKTDPANSKNIAARVAAVWQHIQKKFDKAALNS
ncbi:MAG: hypothetical protein WCY10_06010 [Candidatus Omnitrophota bacterium]